MNRLTVAVFIALLCLTSLGSVVPITVIRANLAEFPVRWRACSYTTAKEYWGEHHGMFCGQWHYRRRQRSFMANLLLDSDGACQSGAHCLRGNFPGGGNATSPLAPPCWKWEGQYYSCFEYVAKDQRVCPESTMRDCRTSVTEGNLDVSPTTTAISHSQEPSTQVATPMPTTTPAKSPTSRVPSTVPSSRAPSDSSQTKAPTVQLDPQSTQTSISTATIAGIVVAAILSGALISVLVFLTMKGSGLNGPAFLPETEGGQINPRSTLTTRATQESPTENSSRMGTPDNPLQPLLFRI